MAQSGRPGSDAEPHSHSRRLFLQLVSQTQTLPFYLFQCSWSQRNILAMASQTLWLMLSFLGLTPEGRHVGGSCKFSRLFLKIDEKTLAKDWLYTYTAWGWSELLHKEFSFACGVTLGFVVTNQGWIQPPDSWITCPSGYRLQGLPLHPQDAQEKLGSAQ